MGLMKIFPQSAVPAVTVQVYADSLTKEDRPMDRYNKNPTILLLLLPCGVTPRGIYIGTTNKYSYLYELLCIYVYAFVII